MPVGRTNGHAREVHAVEKVGVDELGRQVEGEDVEVAGGAMRVHREQRQAVLPQQRLEVGPRGVGALGDGVGALVEDLVEDLQPLVRQPDLVRVGIAEQPRHLLRRVLRSLGPVLAADVASRLLHPAEQRFELRPDRRHDWSQRVPVLMRSGACGR